MNRLRSSQDLWTGDYEFIEVPHTAILGKRWCVNRFAVLAEWWSPHRRWAVPTGARPHQETKGHADVPLHRQAHRQKNFERVNDNDYDALLKDCAPNIHHRFGGHHALGGERHDRETLRRWFQRLGRLCPTLKLTVHDVWVKGWPHNTTIIIRWTGTQTLPDGSPYENHGVHIVRMRWGKVVDIDANEDSQVVDESMKVFAAHGVQEALADPIVS
jgi:ketosteroid isomerase-like protein